MTRAALWRAAPILALLVFIALLLRSTSPPPPPVTPTPRPDPTQLINAHLRAGRLMPALYHVEAQAAQSGWTSELSQMAGRIWAEAGDPDRAARYWQNALDQQPGQITLTRELARTYIELGRWPDALDALKHLLELTPGETWAHYHLGLLLAASAPADANRHLQAAARDAAYRDVAASLLNTLAHATPDARQAMAVGSVLAEHNLWPQAEVAFDYAAALDPTFADAVAYAGLARDRQGKDGSARIAQAIALGPNQPQVRYVEGLHLRLRGDALASLKALRAAANLDPTNPALAAEVGAAYQLLDNLGQAETWFKQAIALSKNDPRFQKLLQTFYDTVAKIDH
jgi:Flp pilus assembly protein TadD